MPPPLILSWEKQLQERGEGAALCKPMPPYCSVYSINPSGVKDEWNQRVIKKTVSFASSLTSCRLLKRSFLSIFIRHTLHKGVRLKWWVRKGPWRCVTPATKSYLMEVYVPPALLREATEQGEVVERKPWGFGPRTPGLWNSDQEGRHHEQVK